MLIQTMNKRCLSCGKVMTEEEAEEHKESSDCVCIGMVQAGK